MKVDKVEAWKGSVVFVDGLRYLRVRNTGAVCYGSGLWLRWMPGPSGMQVAEYAFHMDKEEAEGLEASYVEWRDGKTRGETSHED